MIVLFIASSEFIHQCSSFRSLWCALGLELSLDIAGWRLPGGAWFFAARRFCRGGLAVALSGPMKHNSATHEYFGTYYIVGRSD